MKLPRFRIAWAMVAIAIAIAALDFVAIWTFIDSPSPGGEELLLGALPMANVLAVSILIGRYRPGSRPFILGFAAFGAMALAHYVGWAIRASPGDLISLCVKPFVDLIGRTIGRDNPYLLIPIVACGVVIMLGSPQFLFAMIGGFLSRRYKVTITRR